MERYDQGGYPVRRRRGPKSRIDAGAVRRMAGQGMSDPRIARALGCSVNTVFKVRKENGIPPGVADVRGRSTVGAPGRKQNRGERNAGKQ